MPRPEDHASASAGLLDVRDLRVTYAGSVQALNGVSVWVAEGGVTAVLGSNGAGKSTLLRAISGTLPLHGGVVEGGTIQLAGESLDRRDPGAIVRAGVVHVPEGKRIFGDLTVEENLRAGGIAIHGRRARAEARARVHDLFPILRDRRRQRASLLSGGEQQMLAIGRALMTSPRLLLLDEPSLGLAPQIVDRIAGVIAEIRHRGTSVLLVEQNASMALRLADRAFVLEVGVVSLQGHASELAADDDVRDRYLGAAGKAPAGGRAPRRDPASGRAGPELTVERLTVRFGGISAVSDVSFTVEPGSVHALIGPNGAGKSTCLNVVTGVYSATAGRVRYGDHELTALPPHRIARLGISRTFQGISLLGATVADNLLLGRHTLTRAGFVSTGLGLRRARRERALQEARVREIAELVDLRDRLASPAHALSHGERKWLGLGRALAAEPTLLLLDEPVAGMTAEEAARTARIVAEVRSALGVSVLLVEHDIDFVMGIADNVTVLDFGTRIADGAPEDVRRDPWVLRAYLGSGAAGDRPAA